MSTQRKHRHRLRRHRLTSGFSLLEVMVAMALLSVGLVSIFSSEVGAMNIGNRARRTDIATLLARCKMAEIEEDIAKNGLPAIESSGEGECCEGVDNGIYRCEWSVRRITLPDISADDLSEDATFDLQGAASLADFVPGGAGLDGMATMAIELTFPVLKPAIEEQVRRADVIVSWPEGQATRSFNVVQFLVGEQPPKVPGESEMLEAMDL